MLIYIEIKNEEKVEDNTSIDSHEILCGLTLNLLSTRKKDTIYYDTHKFIRKLQENKT